MNGVNEAISSIVSPFWALERAKSEMMTTSARMLDRKLAELHMEKFILISTHKYKRRNV